MPFFGLCEETCFTHQSTLRNRKKNLQLIESKKNLFPLPMSKAAALSILLNGALLNTFMAFPLAALIPLLPAVTLNKGGGEFLADGDARRINPP